MLEVLAGNQVEAAWGGAMGLGGYTLSPQKRIDL
jgi:hypothetical protein